MLWPSQNEAQLRFYLTLALIKYRKEKRNMGIYDIMGKHQ